MWHFSTHLRPKVVGNHAAAGHAEVLLEVIAAVLGCLRPPALFTIIIVCHFIVLVITANWHITIGTQLDKVITVAVTKPV